MSDSEDCTPLTFVGHGGWSHVSRYRRFPFTQRLEGQEQTSQRETHEALSEEAMDYYSDRTPATLEEMVDQFHWYLSTSASSSADKKIIITAKMCTTLHLPLVMY